nr:MAG TPA: hypothetical protein [Caudoviricetes sp.]
MDITQTFYVKIPFIYNNILYITTSPYSIMP